MGLKEWSVVARGAASPPESDCTYQKIKINLAKGRVMELYAVLVRTGKHDLSNTVLLACSLIGTERLEAFRHSRRGQ